MEGEFTNESNPFMWVPESRASFGRGMGLYRLVDPELAINKRLQFWVDTIIKDMARTWPPVNDIRPPEVNIINRFEFNAFVRKINYIAKVPIVVGKGTEQKACLFDSYGCFPVSSSMQGAYLDLSKEGLPSLLERFKLLFQSNQLSCELRPEADRLLASEGCLLDPKYKDSVFDGFFGFGISSQIGLNQGMVRSLDEDEAVFVLAHELAHYFRAHLFAPPGRYGYFYRRDEQYTIGKPVKAPELESLGKEILASVVPISPPKKGVEISSTLFDMANNWLLYGDCVSGKDCNAICNGAVKLESPVVSSVYASGRLLDACVEDFDYEREFRDFKACASSRSLSVERFNRALERAGLVGVRRFSNFPDPTADSNVYDYLSAISPAFDAALKEAAEHRLGLIRQGLTEKLGWYTEEQEADEIAGEIALRLRLRPDVGVTAMIKLAAAKNAAQGKLCEEAYQAKFASPMAPGSFTDIHHDACFRAYNIYWQNLKRGSEMKVNAQEKRPTFTVGTSWEQDLRELADKFHLDPPIQSKPCHNL